MKKTLSNAYRYYYDKASIFPQQTDFKKIKKFASIINHDRIYSILDLGCAEGELSIYLAKKGHLVTAADISEKQLGKIINKIKNTNLKIDTLSCDIENNVKVFNNDTYDYIFFMDVIEHVKNPTQTLENIRTLLNNNGQLIIHTPNNCSFYKFLRYMIRPRKRQNYYNLDKLGDFHLQGYDYLTIEKTLNFIGIKVIKIIPTKLSFPIINRFSFFNFLFNIMGFLFPMLSDTLLLVCEKSDPIDIDELIENWKKKDTNY